MIQEFVDRFMENKEKLRERFSLSHPGRYEDIVKSVVEIITDDGYGAIDPTRIHCIDDGDYQGTLLFVIAAKGYQPNRYWYVKVGYGPCSGCDTLQAIRDLSMGEEVTEQQVNDYLTLALHIVQEIKEME